MFWPCAPRTLESRPDAPPGGDQLAHAGHVHRAPVAPLRSRREANRVHLLVDPPRDAVDPAEAEALGRPTPCRSSTSSSRPSCSSRPTARCARVIRLEPLPELGRGTKHGHAVGHRRPAGGQIVMRARDVCGRLVSCGRRSFVAACSYDARRGLSTTTLRGNRMPLFLDEHEHIPGPHRRALPRRTPATSRSARRTGSATSATGSTRRPARSSAWSTRRAPRRPRTCTARPTGSWPTDCWRSPRAVDALALRGVRDRRLRRCPSPFGHDALEPSRTELTAGDPPGTGRALRPRPA